MSSKVFMISFSICGALFFHPLRNLRLFGTSKSRQERSYVDGTYGA